ncbi:MAG: bactofilin family protein [Bacillota bacterium]
MRKVLAVFLVVLVSLCVMAAPAMAMDWRQSDRAVIGKDEVIDDDVSLTGASIIIDGKINGDVFAFGNSIVVNGSVNGNLIVAGDRVDIKGTVTGSVFGAATRVFVSGRVERTLAAAGYSVTLEPGAYVGSSGLLAGNLVHANGKIGRGALLGGTHVDVAGQIGKELKAYADNLRIGSAAVIEGPVEYTSGRPATIEQGAPTGAVAFNQNEMFNASRITTTGNTWWKLLRILGFLPVGLAALALFPALIYLSQVLVSWSAGKFLADRLEGFRNLRWPTIFVIGAVLTTVAVALPIVGWLFSLVALLYGLGGLYYLTIQRAA